MGQMKRYSDLLWFPLHTQIFTILAFCFRFMSNYNSEYKMSALLSTDWPKTHVEQGYKKAQEATILFVVVGFRCIVLIYPS